MKNNKLSDKYTIIKHTEYETRGSAPVYIDTTDVMREKKSGKVALRTFLYNNGSKEIKSAYLSIGCFDKGLNLCKQLKNVPYINVDAKAYSLFGGDRVVEIPNDTCSVFAEVSKVLFADGDMWIKSKQDKSDYSDNPEIKNDERLRITNAIREKEIMQSQKNVKKRLSFKKRFLIKSGVCLAIAGVLFGAWNVREYLISRQDCYKTAMNYYINQDFDNACVAFDVLSEKYTYFGHEKSEIEYSAAISYMHCGDYVEALKHFVNCRDYKNSNENIQKILQAYNGLIAAGTNHSAVLNKDGTVSVKGDNSYKQCETNDWRDILSISACGNHTVGVTKNGGMVATGDNDYGQCEVSEWTDIISCATGKEHTVALKSNNRVIARGNNKYGQCNVQDWDDIVMVAASANHTVGLKSDGTVVATGWNSNGQCDVENWSNILYIATGEKNTVGIKTDGSVVIIGDNSRGQCSNDDLKDIIFASVGNEYTVFVNSSGKAIAKGLNDKKQSSVSLWRDIIAIECGSTHTIGLNISGDIFAVGDEKDGKLKVSDIQNIGVGIIDVAK